MATALEGGSSNQWVKQDPERAKWKTGKQPCADGAQALKKLRRCIALPTLGNDQSAMDAFETLDMEKAFRLEHRHAYTRQMFMSTHV